MRDKAQAVFILVLVLVFAVMICQIINLIQWANNLAPAWRFYLIGG